MSEPLYFKPPVLVSPRPSPRPHPRALLRELSYPFALSPGNILRSAHNLQRPGSHIPTPFEKSPAPGPKPIPLSLGPPQHFEHTRPEPSAHWFCLGLLSCLALQSTGSCWRAGTRQDLCVSPRNVPLEMCCRLLADKQVHGHTHTHVSFRAPQARMGVLKERGLWWLQKAPA